jgi:TldD protein
LIDQGVAERALRRSLANGGRFAEVFAERRRGQTLAIDERRIESVQSGAEEGAGVRVVDGNTTYFAHVDGLDPADVERAADEAAAALRAERTDPRPLQARAAPKRCRRSARPSCCASSTSGRAPRAARSPS